MDTISSQNLNSSARAISWLFGLAYLLIIIGIEVSLLMGINPGWGMLAYGLMLISLLVFASLKPENRVMLIGFSSVPIIRIIAYAMPFTGTTLTTHFGVTGLVLLFYIIPTLRVPEIATSHILKFPRNWLTQTYIIIGGVAVGFCQFLVYPQNAVDFRGPLGFIAFTATLVLSAFVEEVMFRGIALTGFTKRFSPGTGIVLVAFIYTSLFIPFGSIELGLVMFLTSLFYGYAAVRLSGLYGVIGAHFVSSLLYYLILPTL